MGRPAKNNAEYFPHFGSMRNHRKVKVLRNKFGNILGYAFWCLMLEWLTEQDGLEWEYSEIECEMFASELGVSAAEIPPLIDFCIQIELLFKTESGFIYSESLNENLAAVFEKRKREKERSKTRKRRENGVFANGNATGSGVSAAEIPQSKVNKRKANKTKIKEVTAAPVVSLFSEEPNNLLFSSSDFANAFNDYLNFRKQIKKTMVEASHKDFFSKLSKLANDDEETAIAILRQSIANGWQGIFELKTANPIHTGRENSQVSSRLSTMERVMSSYNFDENGNLLTPIQ